MPKKIIILILIIIILSSIGCYLYNYRKKKNNYIKFNQNNTISNSHNHTLYKEYTYPSKTHDMHVANIINLRKEKKVRFTETNDFIYYDPEEPSQDLKK